MLFNMEHPRNTEKKRISEKYYLRGIGSPISRIVRDEVYKTDGEYFIVVKDVENCRLQLDSSTTNHIRVKAVSRILVSPLVGSIDEEYDEILMEIGSCVEFLHIEGTWYIVSSDGLKLN